MYAIRSYYEVKAEDFNRAAELYYRNDLSKRHLDEALRFLEQDLQRLRQPAPQYALPAAVREHPHTFFAQARRELRVV